MSCVITRLLFIYSQRSIYTSSLLYVALYSQFVLCLHVQHTSVHQMCVLYVSPFSFYHQFNFHYCCIMGNGNDNAIVRWCYSFTRQLGTRSGRLFTPRVPLQITTKHPPSKIAHISTTTPRFKTRSTRSAPPSVPRTPHSCSVVTDHTNHASSSTVTHFPSVDWQSNYHRAQRSLNKLKLVKFQNWEVSARTPAAEDKCSLVTNWVSNMADIWLVLFYILVFVLL